MEGIWIIFLIIGIISKIMEASKKKGLSDTTKPKILNSDMDVSAKKFLKQLNENFEEMARGPKQLNQSTIPDAEPQFSAIQGIEGECLQEIHLDSSQEGEPIGFEGISTEGAFNKGSMVYEDTRATLMEGSAHPLAKEVDFNLPSKKQEVKVASCLPSTKRNTRSVWAERIIWKEILSEPVALRKRHG
ncbi:hypothetical protein JR334_04430 [Clostridia bacterium]|nr:hypothetical protein JR334_04430 [Clostridia bacterium]